MPRYGATGKSMLANTVEAIGSIVKTYCRIPRSSTQAHGVITDTKTTDTVFVSYQTSELITTEDIPDLVLSADVQALCRDYSLPCTRSHHILQKVAFQILRKRLMCDTTDWFTNLKDKLATCWKGCCHCQANKTYGHTV